MQSSNTLQLKEYLSGYYLSGFHSSLRLGDVLCLKTFLKNNPVDTKPVQPNATKCIVMMNYDVTKIIVID